jgi:NADPH:quinone reductase-like Zn-dependent oxidoreductase
MKGLVLHAINTPLSLQELPTPVPGKGDALVRLRAASLNHRDLYITKGMYAGIRTPVILGSDGCGEWQDKRVLINPGLHWGDSETVQSRDFVVLGMPDNGTFATHLHINQAYLHQVPDHLSWLEAAALPLAGLTAYRVLFKRCVLQRGEKVLVSGVGGGVALLAMQFALAAGASVYVTSGSDEKISRAVQMGATFGVNYNQVGWDELLKREVGGFDVVVDSAGGGGLATLASLCNPGGRIGIYGGTHGKISGLSPQGLFWKQISLLGSSMGSPSDFLAMLKMVTEHRLTPVVDKVFSLYEGNEALQYLEEGKQFGKIVLEIP